MSEATDAATAELVKWVQATGDFVQAQAPLAAQDVLRAGIMGHSMWICGAALVGIIAAALGILILRSKSDDIDAIIWGCICSFGPSVVCLIVVGGNVYWLLVAVYAPRAYLLYSLGVLK